MRQRCFPCQHVAEDQLRPKSEHFQHAPTHKNTFRKLPVMSGGGRKRKKKKGKTTHACYLKVLKKQQLH